MLQISRQCEVLIGVHTCIKVPTSSLYSILAIRVLLFDYLTHFIFEPKKSFGKKKPEQVIRTEALTNARRSRK